MRFATLAVLGLCAIAPAVGGAQSIDALSIAAGTRARLAGPTKSKGYLTVVSVDADSLRFRVEGQSDPRALSWQTIDEMDVSRGIHTNIAGGAEKGFFVGFLVGSLSMALTAASFRKSSGGSDSQDTKSTVEFGLITAGVFACLGAAMGSQPTETWIPVTLPRAPQRSASSRH